MKKNAWVVDEEKACQIPYIFFSSSALTVYRIIANIREDVVGKYERYFKTCGLLLVKSIGNVYSL